MQASASKALASSAPALPIDFDCTPKGIRSQTVAIWLKPLQVRTYSFRLLSLCSASEQHESLHHRRPVAWAPRKFGCLRRPARQW
eukprot:9152568-Pyramimonas_sp.AAC.1